MKNRLSGSLTSSQWIVIQKAQKHMMICLPWKAADRALAKAACRVHIDRCGSLSGWSEVPDLLRIARSILIDRYLALLIPLVFDFSEEQDSQIREQQCIQGRQGVGILFTQEWAGQQRRPAVREGLARKNVWWWHYRGSSKDLGAVGALRSNLSDICR